MMSDIVDLRSDTITKPTAAMRRAMADAEVGDDVFGEDPTARRLEDRAAELLGKEASVFVPSGTMANQIALQLHCRPGDEVIIGKGAHLFFYEGGAGPAYAGVQFVEHSAHLFSAGDIAALVKPRGFHLPRTRLVALENTHNRAGGRVFPQRDVVALGAFARDRKLALHIDGARIWNAAVAANEPESTLCAPADTVSACFSKGLGAPIGSVLAGSRDAIEYAREVRHRMGGAMRQVGVICAAALHALEHHRARLAEDHANARELARIVAASDRIHCDVSSVETNIVNFEVDDAEALAKRAAEEGVLVFDVAPNRIRAVTNLEVTRAQVQAAGRILCRLAER